MPTIRRVARRLRQRAMAIACRYSDLAALRVPRIAMEDPFGAGGPGQRITGLVEETEGVGMLQCQRTPFLKGSRRQDEKFRHRPRLQRGILRPCSVPDTVLLRVAHVRLARRLAAGLQDPVRRRTAGCGRACRESPR